MIERTVEVPVEVEKIVEVEKPVEVERAASGDLHEAARLLANSEFNKEDLSTDEIFAQLQKVSEDEVRNRMGFWAMPLPHNDTDTDSTNIKYTAKKK